MTNLNGTLIALSSDFAETRMAGGEFCLLSRQVVIAEYVCLTNQNSTFDNDFKIAREQAPYKTAN